MRVEPQARLEVPAPLGPRAAGERHVRRAAAHDDAPQARRQTRRPSTPTRCPRRRASQRRRAAVAKGVDGRRAAPRYGRLVWVPRAGSGWPELVAPRVAPAVGACAAYCHPRCGSRCPAPRSRHAPLRVRPVTGSAPVPAGSPARHAAAAVAVAVAAAVAVAVAVAAAAAVSVAASRAGSPRRPRSGARGPRCRRAARVTGASSM